jgi:flagellar hook-associated protein 1 FlgK
VPPTFAFDTAQLTTTSAASTLQPIDNGPYRLFTGVNVVDPNADNAASIVLNPALDPNGNGDPSLLFVPGDATPSVAQRLADGLNAAIDPTQPPYAAIGAKLPGDPATLVQYANTLLAQNATQAADSQNADQFQTQYVASLQQQASSIDGVNVDEELANLTELQNIYQASATVMTTVNQLMDALFAIPTT